MDGTLHWDTAACHDGSLSQIDRDTIHVADRRNDFDLGGAFFV
ncbi:MAG: hypothetical protein OXC11_15435 [Rhodospirillales bacterium]|nr:hypothetical protein [Rhodospirillales bacterium]